MSIGECEYFIFEIPCSFTRRLNGTWIACQIAFINFFTQDAVVIRMIHQTSLSDVSY
jgi:hypothetical protein